MSSVKLFISEYQNKIADLKSEDFENAALELFAFQAKNCPIYSAFIKHLNISISKINKIENIPFLPIDFFKNHEVSSIKIKNPKYFLSSGTSHGTRAKHVIYNESFYHKNAQKGFEKIYGNLNDYLILALLPNYLDQGDSSLISMMSYFLKNSKHKESRFININKDEIERVLNQNKNQKTLLFGVSYALLSISKNLHIPHSKLIVMETGGMKGRGKEIIRKTLHDQLSLAFPNNQIHSEYGMTELYSQAYSHGNGIFKPIHSMKVLCRSLQDPFEILPNNQSGALNIIDLANTHSCAFIASQDLGKTLNNNEFTVDGRVSQAAIRGCNLMDF